MGTPPDVRVRLSAEGQKEVIDAFRKIQAEFDRAGRAGAKGFGLLNQQVFSLGRLLPALTFGAAIAGAIALARNAINAADNLNKLSQRTGVSVETLSAYSHAANLAQLDTEDLAKGLGQLANRMNSAAEGSRQQQRAFEALRIPFRNADGTLRSLDDVLGDVAEKFSQLPDGPRKAGLAADLFGEKLGSRMIPFLNLGREGLKAAREEAERLGLVLSKEAAEAAEKFNDNLGRLQGRIRGLVIQELTPVLPVLVELSQALLDISTNALAAGDSLLGGFLKDFAKFGAFVDAFKRSFIVQIGAVPIFNPTKFRKELETNLALIEKAFEKPAKEDRPKPPGTEPPTVDEGAIARALAAAKQLVDAQLAARQAAREDQLNLIKAQNKLEAAEDKRRFDEGLADLQGFFDRRTAALEAEGAKEIELLAQQAADLEQRLQEVRARPLAPKEEPSARKAEEVKLEQDIARVRNESRVREIALVGDLTALAAEAQEAERQLFQDRKKSEAELAEAEGDRFAAARAALEAEVIGLKRLKLERLKGETDVELAQRSDRELLERQTRLREAGEARIAFQKLQEEARIALDNLSAARREIERQVETGILSQFEGQEKIAALELSRLPVLQQIADAMLAAAITPEQIQAAQQFAETLRDLSASANLSGQRAAEFRQDVEQALTSDLSDFFAQGIEGADSLGDAFRSLAASVVDSLRRIIAQTLAAILVQRVFASVLGPLTAILFPAAAAPAAAAVGGGSFHGFREGGLLTGAGGGLITGPGTGTSDSIPALLSDGEFVVRAAVVRKPGIREALEELNRIGAWETLSWVPVDPEELRESFIRRYAQGGEIGAPGPGGAGGAGGRAEVTVRLAGGLEADRLSIDGDLKVRLQQMERHAKKFRGALGLP